MRKVKIAIVHPVFGWGGTEAVSTYVMEALQDFYEIELITFDSKVTLERLNKFYDAKLDAKKIKLRRVQAPFFIKNDMSRLAILRQHLIMSKCKRLMDEYDLFFSTYNEMDFGVRGIQYVHFPFLVDYNFASLKEENFSKVWYHKPSLIRKLYEKIGYFLSGAKKGSIANNITLVNSNWTGKIFEKAYGVKPITLYPPVPVNMSGIPDFYSRENGFVAIGRIEPTKRFLEIIEVISSVRKAGLDVHLHIIGKPGDEGYFEKIEALRKIFSDWLFLETDLSRDELLRLVVKHKYGIHAKINEHFGIAVAEMIRLGLITFVHDSGGQVEIVNLDELKYKSLEDATNKILNILRDRNLQESLRIDLMKNAAQFSGDVFKDKVRNIVHYFLEGKI